MDQKKQEAWDKAIYINGFRDGMRSVMKQRTLQVFMDAMKEIGGFDEELAEAMIKDSVKRLIVPWELSIDLLEAVHEHMKEYLRELIERRHRA